MVHTYNINLYPPFYWNCPDIIIIIDKQQEVDINNLRLEEELVAGGSRCKGDLPPAPLSKISGVKKPLGHTNSFCGATLPKYGVEPTLEHEAELATVILIISNPSVSF